VSVRQGQGQWQGQWQWQRGLCPHTQRTWRDVTWRDVTWRDVRTETRVTAYNRSVAWQGAAVWERPNGDNGNC
jgi:hypothetical protein